MLRILIADDETIEHKVLTKIVNHSDLPAIIVDTAKTGKETLERYEQHLPDLIFMDIRMPGLSGLDVATVIKNNQPKTVIAIVTAYDEFQYAKRAIDLHIDYFLLKPVEPQEVVRIIRNTLQDKESLDPLTGGSYQLNTSNMSPNRAQLAEDIVLLLHRNYAKPVTLSYIEAKLNFSPQYLSRTFKEAYHTSIMNYLTQLRMKLALKLLADPNLSIAMVAEKVGIPDISYFGQTFKNMQGVTPTQYRNELLQSAKSNDNIDGIYFKFASSSNTREINIQDRPDSK